MYSVVVLMALSTSVDTPDFGRRGCNGCRGWNGCHGCMGGGWYGGCHGCRGGWGGCHGCYGGGWYGCHGCYGGGCYGGGCHGCCGGMVMPPPPPPKPMPMETDKKKTAAPAPATIVVTLPADAKLAIDDYATNSTSGRRTFVSPALEPGKNYIYTLKAEVIRDNKPVTVTREARVRAGETTTVSIDLPTAAVAAR